MNPVQLGEITLLDSPFHVFKPVLEFEIMRVNFLILFCNYCLSVAVGFCQIVVNDRISIL